MCRMDTAPFPILFAFTITVVDVGGRFIWFNCDWVSFKETISKAFPYKSIHFQVCAFNFDNFEHLVETADFLSQLLQAELDIEPSPETQTLVQAIRDGELVERQKDHCSPKQEQA